MYTLNMSSAFGPYHCEVNYRRFTNSLKSVLLDVKSTLTQRLVYIERKCTALHGAVTQYLGDARGYMTQLQSGKSNSITTEAYDFQANHTQQSMFSKHFCSNVK